MAEDAASELRQQPHNLDAERAVLGAILLDNTVLPTVSNYLKETHFYDAAHREIFSAIMRLEARSVSIDPTTLSEELGRAGKLEMAGGPAYIARLEGWVVSTLLVADHARIVRDKALKRQLIRVANQIAEQTYAEEDDAEDLLAKAHQKLFDVQQDEVRQDIQPMAELTHDVVAKIEEGMRRRVLYTGLRTGYTDLDNITSGLQPSDLIVLAGRTSMGKTAFALNISARVAIRLQRPVLIFSLEMSRQQVCQRILSIVSKVDLKLLRSSGNLTDIEFANILDQAHKVGSAPLLIDDTPGIDIANLRTKARHIKSVHEDLGLIVVDYLQLVTDSESRRRSSESRQTEVARISGSLKAIAREVQVPLLALAQLSRQIEQRRGKDKMPILSDLRESGAIEQDADIVMFVHRPDFYGGGPDEDGEEQSDFSKARILISKHRNGRTGRIDLLFHGPTTSFEQLEPADGRRGA